MSDRHQDKKRTQPRGEERSAIDRRRFLARLGKGALAAGAALSAPMIVPRNVLGRGLVPPSDQVSLGFIGCGGMNGGHLNHWLGHPEARVLAVCDVDEGRRNDFKSRVGKDCDTYNDLHDLVARPDIDAVSIATPDHWHALASIAAMEAGKDVYCEKPLTLFVHEGQELIRTARRCGAVFQTGSQQRSDARFRLACELVRSGRLGKLHSVTSAIGGGPTAPWEPIQTPPPGLDWDRWLGPAPYMPYSPNRCFYNFRWFWDYSGGKMTDWGAHHNDISQWGIGADGSGPVEVEGRGVLPEDGLYDTFVSFEVKYKYANGVELTCTSVGENGITFHGTEGEIFVNRSTIWSKPKDILLEPLGAGDVRLYRSDNHHQNWLDCIRTRQLPICDVEVGHRSVTVCHIGNIAMRLGRKLQWDPAKEQFVKDAEANRWLNKPMRKPWTL